MQLRQLEQHSPQIDVDRYQVRPDDLLYTRTTIYEFVRSHLLMVLGYVEHIFSNTLAPDRVSLGTLLL